MTDRAPLVLIVDDDPGQRKTLGGILAARGLRPQSFDRGEPAIAWAAREAPAVALIDLQLEDRPGLEVLQAIKAASPRTECLVLTGHASQASAIEAVNLGAYAYFHKPYDADQLLLAIRRAVEKQAAARALAESEARFRSLYENAPIGIYQTTPEGRILLANPALVEMLGYDSFAELARRNLAEEGYAPSYPRQDFQARIKRDGEVRGLEAVWLRRDGSTIFVRESARLIRDDSGRPLYYEGTAEDITERVQAEAALQESEQTLRRQAEETAALLDVSQALNRLDLETILQTIGERAKALFAADGSRLFLLEPDGETLRCVLALHQRAEKVLGLCIQVGQGVTGSVAARGEPQIVNDSLGDPRAMQVPGTPLEQEVMMFAPLQERGRLLGVLSVSRLGDERPFQPADLELLKALAAMASTAIANARLFEAEHTAREQTERLLAAGQALGATLDLQETFDRILGELRHVVPYDSASVQLLRGERLEIIGGHGFPNLEALLGVSFDLTIDDCPNRQVVRSRAPLILADAPADYDAFRREPHAQAGIRAWLGVPLLYGERLIGIIALDKRQAGFFTPEHARLAQAFAAQAAIAIENARLYQDARRRLQESEQLFAASAALSVSLDVEIVLQTIGRHITAALDAEGCAISAWDREEDALVTLLDYSAEPDWRQPAAPGTRYPLADFPASRQVLTSRQPLAVRVSDPDADPDGVAWMRAEEVLSLLMVPLVIGDRAIGLLELMEARQERTFTQSEISLCQTLANQAAAFLENARLYDEARRRNRELALLNRIIAASAASQEVEAILEAVCRELATYFNAPQAAAALFNEDKTQVVVVAEHLAPGRPSDLGQIIPMAGNSSMAYLLAHKTPLAVDEAQTDPRLAPIHDLMRRGGTASLLLVPLLIEGEVVGSLGVGAVVAHRFTAEEVDLARRVAEQVSGALARARLEESQQRLSTAIEQASETVIITDAQDIIVYVNPAFERTSGYSRAEALGRSPALLESGHHDEAFYRDLWATIRAGQVWKGRFINRKKDGSLYTEDATITPVRNRAGEIVNYVTVKRDVTRELQLEDQFRQAQKIEAVGRLAGGIAHDFNNLLTIIQLSTRLLERTLRPDDPMWQHVQRIRGASQRAANLTKQLLAFSRREIIAPKVVDLNQVIGNLSDMLRRLIGEDIELTTCLADDLWPVKVDPTQAEQVVINLAVNARDAMPGGGKLTLETANVVLDATYAARHLEVEPGDYVLLAVNDTGVGMDKEVRDHLFEPFFTTKEVGKGTGLGLATVFGIVKQNGGHIEVYSKAGQGTTFKIYLPRAAEEAAALSRPPQPAAMRGTETLLVVEDEEEVLELIWDILLSQGYRVLTARDGVAALRVAEAHEGPIHLLLSDVVMPHMSGRELADRLQARRPEMRVLYVSGYTDNAIVHHGVLEEGIAFLPKPFDLETLARKVRDLLDATR